MRLNDRCDRVLRGCPGILGSENRHLCIRCREEKLGRRLKPADFTSGRRECSEEGMAILQTWVSRPAASERLRFAVELALRESCRVRLGRTFFLHSPAGLLPAPGNA